MSDHVTLFKSLQWEWAIGLAVKMPIRMNVFRIGVLRSDRFCLLIPGSCWYRPGRAVVIAHGTGFLPYVWDTWTDFLALSLGLVQPPASGKQTSRWEHTLNLSNKLKNKNKKPSVAHLTWRKSWTYIHYELKSPNDLWHTPPCYVCPIISFIWSHFLSLS